MASIFESNKNVADGDSIPNCRALHKPTENDMTGEGEIFTSGGGTIDGVAKLRREYTDDEGLDESSPTFVGDPLDLFRAWFDEARQPDSGVAEPNAMCLATSDAQTITPSARIVLLKALDHGDGGDGGDDDEDRRGRRGGFVWYTNYDSRKGRDLEGNPQAALCFWWGEMERSVRVEGLVEMVTERESTEYFDSRPVGARLGALASDQSSPIEGGREALEAKFRTLGGEYLDERTGEEKKKVERPPHWGGYRLVPKQMEFWKGRRSRVHDRLLYRYDEQGRKWSIERLQP